MNIIRSGKIAQLPPEIQEQLNQRLANHESSTPLLKWLNALPEVRAVMDREFDGKIIVRQNLHAWMHGGYAEWRRLREAREIVERLHRDSNELTKVADGSVVNITAQWLAVRYVVAMKQRTGRGAKDGEAWERMRECCHDVLALQRSEHLAQRLELDRERLDWVSRKVGELKMEEGRTTGGCELATGKSPEPAASKACPTSVSYT